MVSKALHILVLCCIVFSTTGVMVSHHYCRNELKRTTIFGSAADCHTTTKSHCGKMMASCHQKNQSKKKCCHNEAEFYKLDQDQQIQHSQVHPLKQPKSLALLPAIPLAVSAAQPFLVPVAYLHFKPPILFTDLQGLLQVFRF